jgi:RNA polymerase sigma-B factor
VQERALEVTALVESLTHGLRRSPTVQELARAGGFSEEQVIEAVEASSGYTRAPMELTDRGPAAARLSHEDPALDGVEDFSTVERLLRCLPERQRQIMALRYFANETQETIARRFGVSQMQISRLLARSLRDLRAVAERGEAGKASSP